MTVLITGSNGFVGSAVAARLLRDDEGPSEVRCLVRTGSDLRRLDGLRHEFGDRFQLVVGSLATVDAAVEAIGDATTVIHLAAGLSGAPAELFANTVVTSDKLLKATLRRSVPPKVVLVSSFSVYRVADLWPGDVVDESTPLETEATRRDPYAFAKAWQERMFWDVADRVPLVVVRPGVVYGPGGGAMSTRVGISLGSLLLHLGGDNVLPVTYVENCADAIVALASAPSAVGQAFNVVDDELVTASEYLRRYRREVQPMRSLRVPYCALLVLSRWLVRYNAYSGGQLPDVFTPYKAASLWKPQRFDNAKLKAMGWHPRVSTNDGLSRTFAALRTGDA